MDIINLTFEEELTVNLHGTKVKVTAFKTPEHGNVKFGVSAPRSVTVNREEVQQQVMRQSKVNQNEAFSE